MKVEELNLLSKEYIIEHGTYFDGDAICWSGKYGDQVYNEAGEPFTGLLYEFYQNGNIAYYSFYENGIKNGLFIEFYPSGNVKRYVVFNRGLSIGKSFQWYENGAVKKEKDHYKNDYHYRYVEYDEEGNIVRNGEV